MRSHTTAVIIRTILYGLVLGILLPMFSKVLWWQAIAAGVVLLIFTYVFTDLGILPRYGNTVAVVVDIIAVALGVVIIYYEFNGRDTITPWGAVIILGLLAVGEWFFHKYLNVYPVKR